jgi:acetoin utilization protein AcuC
MRTAFIYTDAYLDYDYGPMHPLRVVRLKLTFELIKAYGLLDLPSVQLIPAIRAEEEDLALFHGKEYIEILKQANRGHLQGNAYAYGLGPGDNPVFPGLLDWSLLITGATLQAVDFVADGEGETSFSIAGGLHHAMRSKASGFCYTNDPVIGISRLLSRGMRVAYIDLDAHHGDGVQTAFYETDQVLTISLHESGYSLFPGTGFEYEIGEGRGEGFSVNLPFPAFTDDETYLWAFDEVIPELIEYFCPDILVTQLGVDTFEDDPLTHLHLSIFGFEKVIRRIKDLARRWVALGGGGYEISNVARAWTLAWAVMNRAELEEELPSSYIELASKYGVHEQGLRGHPPTPDNNGRNNREIRMEMERIVQYLRGTVFPKVRK